MTDDAYNTLAAARTQATREYAATDPDWSPWHGEGTAAAEQRRQAYHAVRVPEILADRH